MSNVFVAEDPEARADLRKLARELALHVAALERLAHEVAELRRQMNALIEVMDL